MRLRLYYNICILSISSLTGYYCWTSPWDSTCIALSVEMILFFLILGWISYKDSQYGLSKKLDGFEIGEPIDLALDAEEGSGMFYFVVDKNETKSPLQQRTITAHEQK